MERLCPLQAREQKSKQNGGTRTLSKVPVTTTRLASVRGLDKDEMGRAERRGCVPKENDLVQVVRSHDGHWRATEEEEGEVWEFAPRFS